MPAAPPLGLRANAAPFALLVLVNALVGAVIGLERSILPALAEDEFRLHAHGAMLGFVAVFGVAKALTNLVAGHLSDRHGRKGVLVAGWLVTLPVPFLLIAAPSWGWVLFANALLGVGQGLTWSTTVIMKVDLAGPARRGLALGLNEFAGYVAVALSALATGAIAERWGLRPAPFLLGVGFVVAGLLLSALLVRETRGHAAREAADHPPASLGPLAVFARVTWRDRHLSAVTQAGVANNLNDGVAWGLFPLLYAGAGLDLGAIGTLAALYPAVWGVAQLATGALSDRLGRKGLVVGGLWVQALGIAVVVRSDAFAGFAAGNALLGLGTAMVYPTLLAALGDVAHPSWRASALGVYRGWRDAGYAIGALLAGLVADRVGLAEAVWVVAGTTFLSGVVALARMDGRPDAAAVAAPGWSAARAPE